jgi:hypothetical protein
MQYAGSRRGGGGYDYNNLQERVAIISKGLKSKIKIMSAFEL